MELYLAVCHVYERYLQRYIISEIDAIRALFLMLSAALDPLSVIRMRLAEQFSEHSDVVGDDVGLSGGLCGNFERRFAR